MAPTRCPAASATTPSCPRATGPETAVFGSAGNDRFVLSGTLFSGNFDGGADSDTIDGSAIVSNATLTINLADGSYRFDSGTFTLINTEHAIGGAGADTITGSGIANSLDGGAATTRSRATRATTRWTAVRVTTRWTAAVRMTRCPAARMTTSCSVAAVSIS